MLFYCENKGESKVWILAELHEPQKLYWGKKLTIYNIQKHFKNYQGLFYAIP